MSVSVEYVPDLARDAAFELINGHTFAGRLALAFYELPTDYTEVGDDHASVLIYSTGGTDGYIDRVDRLTVKVYAPGQDAVRVAETIRAVLVESPHDLEVGFVDRIRCEVTPYDAPYPATVNEAYSSYLVTHRPW